MLIIGYFFGIRSKRRLCDEVHLNLAYRWFCRLRLEGRVPDHLPFWKNRLSRGETSMAFKDLLLQLSSYPDATPPGAIEQAVSFAEAVSSRLSALTFEIDIRVPSNMLANALLDIPGMIAAERARSLTNARDLVSLFESAAAERPWFEQKALVFAN